MGRRGIKEYRAPEALILIAADRDQKPLVCPSCNSAKSNAVPERSSSEDAQGGRVTLHCAACGRTAAYIPRTLSRSSLPEAPRPHPDRRAYVGWVKIRPHRTAVRNGSDFQLFWS